MGQYYGIVNLDKKQYLSPHDFGDLAKLREFGYSSMGTLTALTLLLASGNGRGGGDFPEDSPLIGSWAGDRIVITGDYDDNNKWGIEGPDRNLYQMAEEFENIGIPLLRVMAQDEYLCAALKKSRKFHIQFDPDSRIPEIDGEPNETQSL